MSQSNTDSAAMTDRLVAFIAQNLVKTADLGGGAPLVATSETAERFNDSSWFWTDDNAKMAELFCAPHIRDRYVALADATIDFVLRMSHGTVIRRRCGPPELHVVSDDPRAFHVRNAFFSFEGDLTHGVVRHSARFNDGRAQDVAHHTGNLIQLRFRGRRYTIDMESAITEYGIEPGEDRVVLRHASSIMLPVLPVPLSRRRVKVGTARYEYTIWADRTAISLRVAFEPEPGVAISDVVLTTGYDKCGDMVEFRALSVGTQGGYRVLDELGNRRQQAYAGPASYLGMIQAGNSPGFSYAMHALLRTGERLKEIVTMCYVPGRVHWLTCRYAMGNPSGAPMVIEEERLLTAGGYYDDPAHYAEVMRNGGDGGQDPSMTYDIGAEMNAVAVLYLFGMAGRYAVDPPSQGRLANLRSWYDRHLDRFVSFLRPGEPGEGGRAFGRGVAFVALSLDCMLRATGDARYRGRMDQANAVLLRLFDRIPSGTDQWEGCFIDTWTGRVPFLDVHAAGMLALARCAYHGDPGGQYSRTLNEAVRGLKINTITWTPGPGLTVTFDTLVVRSRVEEGRAFHEDPGYWNFKLGLQLRALHAVRQAAADGVIELEPAIAQRVAFLIDLARRFLLQSVRDHGSTLEVLTGQRSGETNSETQPWVTMALDPSLDQAITAVPVPRNPG